MRSRNASPLTASGQSTPRSDTPPTHQITPPTRQMTPPINNARVNTNSLSAAANRRSEGDHSKHDDPIGNSFSAWSIILRPGCFEILIHCYDLIYSKPHNRYHWLPDETFNNITLWYNKLVLKSVLRKIKFDPDCLLFRPLLFCCPAAAAWGDVT